MNKDLLFYSKVWAILIGIPILLNIIVSFIFCTIDKGIEYSWYSGLFHGLCVIGNLVLYVFDTSRLIKASGPSVTYYVCFGIGVLISGIIISVLKFLVDSAVNKYIDRTSDEKS